MANGLKRTNRGRGHSYKLDGRPVPGVTTLISSGLPKPALAYWSARTVAEYVADADDDTLAALRTLGRDGMVKALKEVPWTGRDTAAVRGTKVHRYAERIVNGERVPEDDDTLPVWGYIESCVRFLDDWRAAPVLTETVVGSRRHRYAGTLDLVADLPDGRRALMDYKTSNSGVWPEAALQLAAYRHADFYLGSDGSEVAMKELGINCAYAVWLRADGYDVIPLATSERVFEAFLNIATVARQVTAMHEWVGEAERWHAVAA
jgi:hypothetical protein